MKCFNCGREFDEKHPEIACTIVNTRTGEDANVRTISLGKQTLALCHYCVRAMAIGGVNAADRFPYKFKDLEYEYVEENADEQSNGC